MKEEEQGFLVSTEVMRSKGEITNPKLDLRDIFRNKTVARDFKEAARSGDLKLKRSLGEDQRHVLRPISENWRANRWKCSEKE